MKPIRPVRWYLFLIAANVVPAAYRGATPVQGSDDLADIGSFSPDGMTLATSDRDYFVETFELRDPASGKKRKAVQFSRKETVWNLAFSPAGQFLAASVLRNTSPLAGEPLVQLRDAATGELRHT